MSLSAYRRRATNLIDWARDEDGGEDTPWQTRNVESATFRGLEATLHISAGEANVAIQGSVASLTGDHVEGFVSKYALRPLVRDLVAMAGRSFGPVKGQLSARHRRRQGEAGYWLLDMRLGVAIRVGEFYLDILNGLGVEYQEVTGVPAPGRSLILGYRSG
jgi:outer membrane cobalamin receptor